MSWLTPVDAQVTPFEAVLGLRPELLELYRAFYGQLWDTAAAPPRLLELCRLRIAALHGCEAESAIRQPSAGVTGEQVAALDRWRDAPCFSAVERAALAVAEKMPWQHHAIDDGEVAALRAHLGDAEAIALLVAMALFDATCRLRLVLGLEPRPVEVDAPASENGRLY
jgi:alkylhydroperoxidase family enzyme